MITEQQVLELFCGAGGMGQGFSHHFQIAKAIDISEPAVRTYGANHAETEARREDVRLLTGCRGDFDGMTGVIGGPPCQGSSIINTKRCAADPRNELMTEFMRLVTEIKPAWFVMENVPGVPADRKGSVISAGQAGGYTVKSVYMNAAEYGAFQTRKRWIVVGIRGREWILPATRPAATVQQAFSQIQNNWGMMQSNPRTLEALARATYEWTPISGKFRNMIKLQRDKPAPAVVNLKKVYMVHPDEVRNISLAEAAVLQGFPAGYIWKGTESQTAQMIANAMPAQLAEAIAGSLAGVAA